MAKQEEKRRTCFLRKETAMANAKAKKRPFTWKVFSLSLTQRLDHTIYGQQRSSK